MVSAAAAPEGLHRPCQCPPRTPRPPRQNLMKYFSLPYSASCVVRWRGCCLDHKEAGVLGDQPRDGLAEGCEKTKEYTKKIIIER
jgi:hypothetical protein